ncbi:MAG: NADH-quinone oxidoreductase subunit C [Phycisphaerales bacterium JB038]
MPAGSLNHPTFPLVKAAFPDRPLKATEYRDNATLIVEPGDLHEVLRFLRQDEGCRYDFLSDITAVDYLGYPAPAPGRFGVVYVLVSTETGSRFLVKTHLDPTIDTSGIDEDPALVLDSACDLWAGAEWLEREVFDMFGIRFRNHPDLRRILTWKDFPAHPLRKDYPLRGRGERENYQTIEREE